MADLKTNNFNRIDYCSAVIESLGYNFIGENAQRKIDLRTLFYPININEGTFAIKNYEAVMRHVDTITDDAPLSFKEKMAVLLSMISDSSDEPVIESESKRHLSIIKELENKQRIIALEDDIKSYSGSESANENTQAVPLDSETKIKVAELQSSDDFSFSEEHKDFVHHLIFANMQSRILLLASAGHGKTTLLNRLMLFYSKLNLENYELDKFDDEIIANYYLPTRPYLPIKIVLRDATDNNFDIDTLIKRSVISILKTSTKYADCTDSAIDAICDDLLNSTFENDTEILLLIDGLDEVPDKYKLEFLTQLEDYLKNHKDIKLILTTRVSGLNDKKTLKLLKKIRFKSRSIMPFTEKQTKEYALNWIKQTQSEEIHDRLINSLDYLLENNRFAYLKNFLRHPLELLIILNQLVGGNLYLNKYMMFYSILKELFTRHEHLDKKEHIFSDRMNLISFIAYKMQHNAKMFISRTEIANLCSEIENLSFHTNILNNDLGTEESVIEFLEYLASNAGVVETQKTTDTAESVYTFPIRTYQEFLASFAACNIRLNDEDRPDPEKIAIENLFDNRWSEVIIFMLSDLFNNNRPVYDEVFEAILNNLRADSQEDTRFLKAIFESGIILNTKAHAEIVAKKYFSDIVLTSEKKDLLALCLSGESASELHYALQSLVKQAFSNKTDNYFEAYARTKILIGLKTNKPILAEANKFLKLAPVTAKTGAYMLVVQREMILDESDEKAADILENDNSAEDNICSLLFEKFEETQDKIYVIALSSLYLSEKYTSSAKSILTKNPKCGYALRDALEENAEDFFFEANNVSSVTFLYFKRLVYALGTYPVTRKLFKHRQSNNTLFISNALQQLFQMCKDEISIGRPKTDVIAVIMAQYNYCKPIGDYLLSEYIDEDDSLTLANSTKRITAHKIISLQEFKEQSLISEKVGFDIIMNTVYESIKSGDYLTALEKLNILKEHNSYKQDIYIVLTLMKISLQDANTLNELNIVTDDMLEKPLSGTKWNTFLKFYNYYKQEDFDKAYNLIEKYQLKPQEWNEVLSDRFVQLFTGWSSFSFIVISCTTKAFSAQPDSSICKLRNKLYEIDKQIKH